MPPLSPRDLHFIPASGQRHGSGRLPFRTIRLPRHSCFTLPLPLCRRRRQPLPFAGPGINFASANCIGRFTTATSSGPGAGAWGCWDRAGHWAFGTLRLPDRPHSGHSIAPLCRQAYHAASQAIAALPPINQPGFHRPLPGIAVFFAGPFVCFRAGPGPAFLPGLLGHRAWPGHSAAASPGTTSATPASGRPIMANFSCWHNKSLSPGIIMQA